MQSFNDSKEKHSQAKCRASAARIYLPPTMRRKSNQQHKMLVEASNLHPITTNTQFNTKSTQKLSLFGEAQRGESEDFRDEG